MRSPQVICYPVEPSIESADTVSTLEYEVSTGHMLPSRTQPSTESANTVSTLGYEVSTGHMLPSRTQPSTESDDTVGTLEYEVSTGHMLPSRTQYRVPTLSALWGMRCPQVICYPVEPSTESANTVST